ncbi:cellulase family glycosylhydrolase [Kineococcus sp. R8]|uniref:cellulase family glycosylhydrolase n=1 Tax=Kineococcus siccus TaxID=2696567 RepID=UPI001412F5F9|nr:cellulase family glycosylhydrolase [Kineococcus siccus]NAZ82155.1 cellulase family glycosylhydrolase [Kineococcus siccus]
MSLRTPALVRLLAAAVTGAAALTTVGAGVAAAAPTQAAAGTTTTAATTAAKADRSFVTRDGDRLEVGGKNFRFAGTNNYYLHYKSAAMRDAVLDKAADSGFDVVRTWGWFDVGTEEDPTAGSQENTYLQYWDGSGHPKYNDGPNGLAKLDAVIARAQQDGLRLVIPFTNNWEDFGGMDKYVEWAGGDHHDDFYTDPTIRGWYKDYISHLLNHTNTITGVKYKDDPTIMTWELANEPRCVGSGDYPASSTCTSDTLTSWADDVSTFIKSIDRNHLVSVGDEGFFCDQPSSTDWTHNCSQGVDTVRFAALKNVDVMSYHLYPDAWGKDADWGTQYIVDHATAAKQVGKPVMLGEFGLRDKAMRNPVYKIWTDTAYQSGTTGALYWILSDAQDDGTLYPDYDGFTVYCPSAVCTTLSNSATRFRSGTKKFAPVADDDTAATTPGTSVSSDVTVNDVAYAPARLRTASVDLDPAAGGTQTTRSVAGGTFTVNRSGTVTFAPTTGFTGTASTTYTVTDSKGRVSNAPTLTVTVAAA